MCVCAYVHVCVRVHACASMLSQGLNITQQLDAGIRFLDFRIMYTGGPDNGELAHAPHA